MPRAFPITAAERIQRLVVRALAWYMIACSALGLLALPALAVARPAFLRRALDPTSYPAGPARALGAAGPLVFLLACTAGGCVLGGLMLRFVAKLPEEMVVGDDGVVTLRSASGRVEVRADEVTRAIRNGSSLLLYRAGGSAIRCSGLADAEGLLATLRERNPRIEVVSPWRLR